MSSDFYMNNVPGTILNIDKVGNLTGNRFLDSIFLVSNGIMLNQIRDITGIDGSTLQNWTKRGWVNRPNGKFYTREHLARILIINMMSDTMQFTRMIEVLQYINGDLESTEDDIITDSMLYDYICSVLSVISEDTSHGIHEAEKAVDKVLEGYIETYHGAKNRLRKGLIVIVTTYYSSLIKAIADRLVDEIEAEISAE